jgi:hypothetical protein
MSIVWLVFVRAGGDGAVQASAGAIHATGRG